MHALHFIVTSAESGKEACNDVDNYIADWGNENNWRSICGAVSEDNKVFINDNDRGWLNKDCNTIKKINGIMEKHLKEEKTVSDSKEIMKKYLDGKFLDVIDWYKLEVFCRDKGQKLSATKHKKNEKFNVLTDSYNEYSYDYLGVTHTGYDKSKYTKLWVVFVDMHS
jgi:hypothetical protein